MPISRSLTGIVAVALFAMSQGAYAQSPLPQLPDSNFQACLSEQATKNGWAFAEDVTALSCANRGIASLSGVGLLTNLGQLDLAGNRLVTAYEISNLSRLSKLNLAGNTALQGMEVGAAMTRLPALTSLNLNGINVGSITALNGLNNPATGQKWQFVELDLGNTNLKDEYNSKTLEFLRPIASLKKLNLEGNGIINTDGISNFPALEELNLANNDLPFVGNLRYNTLTRLNLSGNRQLMAQDVAQIINGNPLTSLGLNGIAIGNINNLGSLIDSRTGQPLNLTELDVGNAGIKDANGEATLQFLRLFPNLRKVNVANSGIRETYPLDSMSQMEELDLSGNQLSFVGNLGQMHNLTRLNLSGNRSLRFDEVANTLLAGNPKLSAIGLNGIRIGQNTNWLNAITLNHDQAVAMQELDLGNTGLDAGSLASLQAFPNLLRLNLAGNRFPLNTGLYALRDAVRLQDLDLSGNQINDLSSFFSLGTLKRLNLGNTPVRVDDVRWMIAHNPGLTSIGLNGIAIGGDISKLGDLRNQQTGQYLDLTELDLGNTGLQGTYANSGFTFLRNFPNLQRLNLAGNAIFDLQEIRDLPNLTDLDISNNRLMILPFGGSNRLTRLNLSGNTALRVQEVAGWIGANPNLQSLGLNGIAIGAFANLGPMTNFRTGQPLNLTELDLGNTGVKDANGNASLQFLQPFANLRKLNLANNGINETGALGTMTQLEELDLSGNQLPFLGNLPSRNFSRLNLSGNRNLRFDDIAAMLINNPKLNSIGLNGIRIGQNHNWLYSLSSNPEQALDMQELDLGNTGFDANDVQSLSVFANLQRLNLAGNNFPVEANLSALRNLNKLRDLDLSGNSVRDLYMLGHMGELRRLNLNQTQVRVEDVRSLINDNPNLTSLGLNGVAVGNISNLGDLRSSQTWQYLNLTELDLGNSGLLGSFGEHRGFDFLRNFPNLQRLNMAGNGIVDFYEYQGLPNLLDLDVSNNSLLGLPSGQQRNLTRLNVSGNPALRVYDVGMIIGSNPGLTSLGLNGIAIGSINNLPPLVDTRTGQPMALTELDLGNTGLLDQNGQKSISFLAPLVKLQRLNLAGNGLLDVAMLGQFASLRDLDLSNNALMDVSPLANLRNLDRLNLSGNLSLNPAPLRGLIDQSWNLTSLGLNGIALRDLAAIGNLQNPQTGRPYDLEELDLGNTQLGANGNVGLYQVTLLSGLKRLNLAGNGLTGSARFDLLTKLTDLDLSNNQLLDVQMWGTRDLTRLNLSGNSGLNYGNVGSILNQNPGLTRIGLNGIPLGSLSNIGSFGSNSWQPMKLVELDIGNTAMQDLDGLNFLQSFPAITRLNLAGNGLQSLNGLRNLAKLIDLDLSNNTTLRWLYDVNFKGSLKTLNLAGDTNLECVMLDMLVSSNPEIAITRPATCVTPNQPPQANAGADQSVDAGSNAVLSGSATDSDGSIVSYDWLQTAGPAVTLATPKAAATTFVAPVVAVDTVFTFQLSVLDDKGASASNTTNVTVKAKPNVAPTASAGSAQTVTEGASVKLTGSGSDSDGTIASYKWVQTAGPAVTLATPDAASTTFTAPQVSANTLFSFRLTVTDNQGASANASTNVTVKDAADLVVSSISVLASQTNPLRGATIPVTVYTKNSGNKATTAVSSTALYLTTNPGTVTTADLLLRSVSIPSGLAAGATTTSSTSIKIPSTLAPGVYYIGAIADYTGKAAEANEGNNSLVGSKITVR